MLSQLKRIIIYVIIQATLSQLNGVFSCTTIQIILSQLKYDHYLSDFSGHAITAENWQLQGLLSPASWWRYASTARPSSNTAAAAAH